MEQLTRDMIVDSLYSRTCPACGGEKNEEKTCCWRCYSSLPMKLQDDLEYTRVGHGYEEAVHAAMAHLGVETFHVGR